MVIHESERKTRAVYGEGLRDVGKRILIGPRDWHHAVYVLEGEGSVRYEEVDQPIRRGSVVYTEPNRLYGFNNTGED